MRSSVKSSGGSSVERQGDVCDGGLQEVFGGIARQQREHFAPQLFVAATDARQISFALGRRTIRDGAEYLFDALPSVQDSSAIRSNFRLPFHGAARRAPVACSWPMVVTERPSASAVSSKLNPAEVTQLDDADFAFVELRQRDQRIVERHQFGGLSHRKMSAPRRAKISARRHRVCPRARARACSTRIWRINCAATP